MNEVVYMKVAYEFCYDNECGDIKSDIFVKRHYYGEKLDPFMHNVVKCPNILSKSCGVHIARFLKYAWPF